MEQLKSRRSEAWGMIKSLYAEMRDMGLDHTFRVGCLNGGNKGRYGDKFGVVFSKVMSYMANVGVVDKVGYDRVNREIVYQITERAASMIQKNPDVRLGEVVSKVKRYGKKVVSSSRGSSESCSSELPLP